MRVSKFIPVLMVVACGAVFLFRCTGIETTNGITVVASAASISGSVPPHASVSLYDTAFIPFIDSGISLAMTAGESGVFDFNDLLPGVYNVIVATPDGRNAALVPCITLENPAIDSQYRATLEPVGSISGSITNVPDTIVEVLIYLEGTGYYARLPGTATFTIDQVPAGNYNLQISSRSLLENTDRNGSKQPTSLPVSVSPTGNTNTGTIVFVP